MHKSANVLNELPSSVQGKAKKDLHAIDQAENREPAEKAFDRLIAKYGTEHDKAADCLVKDRAALLASIVPRHVVSLTAVIGGSPVGSGGAANPNGAPYR